MPMRWRHFLLLCAFITSVSLYFIDPFRHTVYSQPIDTEDEMEILPNGGFPLVALSLKNSGGEFAVLNNSRKLCGKYFFVKNISGDRYIGFYLLIPGEIANHEKAIPFLFPEKSFIVVVPWFDSNIAPRVQFSNGEIILQMNRKDFDQTWCFKNRILV